MSKINEEEIKVNDGAMKIITTNMPQIHLEWIETHLESPNSLYPSRSELFRVAIRDAIYFFLEEIKKSREKKKDENAKPITINVGGKELSVEELDKRIQENLKFPSDEDLGKMLTQIQKNREDEKAREKYKGYTKVK